MRAHSDGAAGSLIFPGVGGRPLNGGTLVIALRRATGTDVHGFRSSFRTWAAERSGATRDVAELALAHVVGGAVERSYARSDLFDQRRVLDGPMGGVRDRPGGDAVTRCWRPPRSCRQAGRAGGLQKPPARGGGAGSTGGRCGAGGHRGDRRIVRSPASRPARCRGMRSSPWAQIFPVSSSPPDAKLGPAHRHPRTPPRTRTRRRRARPARRGPRVGSRQPQAGPLRRRPLSERSSRRRCPTWSRTRSRWPMRGRTCSSGGGC